MLSFHRLLIVYVVAIPLALMLGYMVATPDMASMAVVGLVLSVLALPLLMQWSHWLVIFLWNSAFIAGFLPGQLRLWIVFGGLTFGLGLVNHVMGHRSFLRAPALTKPLLFLAAVVVLTAKIRGGVGLKALGSGSFGGKHYVYLLGAIIGYFALTSQPISIPKGGRTVKWFFLSELSHGAANLIYSLGPALYVPMYYFLSPDFAAGTAAAEFQGDVVIRYGGLAPSATGLLCFILARWGIRGILEWDKPWRLLSVIVALAAGLLSGFRSEIAFLCLLLVVQFMIEGLWRTPFLPVFVCLSILCAAPVLLFANKMPFAVQRTLAFLPVDVNPEVRAETAGSTGWRIEMWQAVWPEVPKYLLVGKGYALNPTDLYLAQEAGRMGLLPSYSEALTAGDYHSGPLSVLIPFGIAGTIAFLWLLGAGIKVLYCNRRYGDPRLKLINDFFFAYFLTQGLYYFLIYGAFDTGLALFLGVLGLSVSLNGGVCRKPSVPRKAAIPSSLAEPVAVA